jgi:tetratricopeptide (TPR) repeat protein
MHSEYPAAGLLLSLITLAGCAHQAAGPAPRTDTGALRQCAEAAYRQDNPAESERCYLQLAGTEAMTARDWYRLGNLRARSGRPYLAIQAYAEALTRDPALTDARYNLGLVHMQQAVKSFSAVQQHSQPGAAVFRDSERLRKGMLELLDDGGPEAESQ